MLSLPCDALMPPKLQWQSTITNTLLHAAPLQPALAGGVTEYSVGALVRNFRRALASVVPAMRAASRPTNAASGASNDDDDFLHSLALDPLAHERALRDALLPYAPPWAADIIVAGVVTVRYVAGAHRS